LRVVSVNPVQPDDVTQAKWKDSWLVAFGAEFSPDDRWTWRGGVAIDMSPIPSATITPRIPDANRTWLSVGVTYRASESFSIALSYAHLFLPQRAINLTALQTGNALRGNLLGRSEADANAFGIQLNYRMP
jgi:long-chain fatty acid transport protein